MNDFLQAGLFFELNKMVGMMMLGAWQQRIVTNMLWEAKIPDFTVHKIN